MKKLERFGQKPKPVAHEAKATVRPVGKIKRPAPAGPKHKGSAEP